MKFTLRQLEVFVAVAQQESVSRAAEGLSLSQSATSTSLGELERQFDCKLFDRAGKRLTLNALGRQLLPQAVALLDRGEEIENLLNGKTAFGSLDLGATLKMCIRDRPCGAIRRGCRPLAGGRRRESRRGRCASRRRAAHGSKGRSRCPGRAGGRAIGRARRWPCLLYTSRCV